MIKQSKNFNNVLPLFAKLKRAVREQGLQADQKNSRFNSQYASIMNVRNTFEPLFESQNWFLSVDMTNETQESVLAVRITARLTFLGKGLFNKGKNEWIELETSYPVNRYSNSGDYPSPQKIEATRTYGSRCCILALIGISAEIDDDGNKSSNTLVAEKMQGAVDFDGKLNCANSLFEIETILNAAKEACELGTLSSMAFSMLSKKAEGKLSDRKVAKSIEQRKVERQAKIIEKLNTAMIQATSLGDLETVWGNFHKVQDDLKDIDCKQIKYDLHQEAMRISKQLIAGEVFIAKNKDDQEIESTVGEIQDLLDCPDSDNAIPQLEIVDIHEPQVQQESA